MNKGIAFGGPRDGVKLEADESWDGKVKLPEAASNARATDAYYNGHYRWCRAGYWEWWDTTPRRHRW